MTTQTPETLYILPDTVRERVAPGFDRSVWLLFFVPVFDVAQITGTCWEKPDARRYNAQLMRSHGLTFVHRWLVLFAIASIGLFAAGRLEVTVLSGFIQAGMGLLWLAVLAGTTAMCFIYWVVLHPLKDK